MIYSDLIFIITVLVINLHGSFGYFHSNKLLFIRFISSNDRTIHQASNRHMQSSFHRNNAPSMKQIDSNSMPIVFGRNDDSFKKSMVSTVIQSTTIAILCQSIILFGSIPSANAAEDAASKATKAFELCLSKCMYQETRPPPINSDNERLQVTRERGEILRECKSKCAVTKDQLLLGKPKQSKPKPSSP